MQFISKYLSHRFTQYTFVGVAATLLDWSTFLLLSTALGIHYATAVTISFLLGGIAKFILNRLFTFKSTSKKILSQYTVFVTFSLVSLCISILLMYFFVEIFSIPQFPSRIVTTFLVLFLNYVFDTSVTFNKKVFSDH